MFEKKGQISEQDFTPEITPNHCSTHTANGQKILAALELQYRPDCQTCKKIIMSQKGRLFHCVEKNQVSEQDFTPEIAPNHCSTHTLLTGREYWQH